MGVIMFRVENYVMLYIKEYTGYIFDSIGDFTVLSKRKLDDMKQSILQEMQLLVNNIANTFELDINNKSVALMQNNKDYIEKNDKNHLIPYYRINLKDAFFDLMGGSDYFTLSFNINGIVINSTFNIKTYLKNKDFHKELEAYTTNNKFFYNVLEDGKIWCYNKDTYCKMNLANLNNISRNDVIYPDDVFIVGIRQEMGFLQLIIDIYNFELSNEKMLKR